MTVPSRLTATLLLLLVFLLFGCAAGDGDSSDDGDNTSIDSGDNTGTDDSFSRIANFCGTSEPDDDTKNRLASAYSQFVSTGGFSSRVFGKAESTVDIPVVFHVIAKGDSLEDGQATEQSMREQIDILNQAYSTGVGTPFRFHLEKITRTINPGWHVMSPGSPSEVDAKGALHEGGAETLNIYLVTIEGKILGYTTLPVLYSILSSFDGVVMNFRTLPGGSINLYNTGNVLVHEVGHWLGLLHTFSGDCGAIIGDLVQDTPVEKIPTTGEFCPVGRDSCPDQTGIDPIHNHMTYTVDSCRSEFTTGQVDFMLFNSFAFRGLPVL